jgi:hypothetical protein
MIADKPFNRFDPNPRERWSQQGPPLSHRDEQQHTSPPKMNKGMTMPIAMIMPMTSPRVMTHPTELAANTVPTHPTIDRPRRIPALLQPMLARLAPKCYPLTTNCTLMLGSVTPIGTIQLSPPLTPLLITPSPLRPLGSSSLSPMRKRF